MADKPELPDLPALEAPASEHLDFANAALRRRWNLIARVRKFGSAAPMVVLVFEQGDELRLNASQHRYGPGLIDQLVSFDGQLAPAGYSAAQLRVIYAALIRACDVWDVDEQRDVLFGDVNAFLGRCLNANDQPPIIRPDDCDEDPKQALYRAVRDFQTLNEKRTGHPAEAMPVLFFWHHVPDWHGERPIELWVPRQALQTWLRAVRNWIGYADLRNILHYFGWQERHLQVRNPSDWRRRAHTRIWMVPVPWEDCETDLLNLAHGGSDAIYRVPTSPGGTERNTRARAPEEPSRARIPGDAWGRWDGVGGTLRQSETTHPHKENP